MKNFQTKFREIRFNLQFEVRHRTAPNGRFEDWTINDRFAINVGLEQGLIYAYQSKTQSAISVQNFLSKLECSQCLAEGCFGAKQRTWIFETLGNKAECLSMVQRLLADDVNILRYYGNYQIVTGDGEKCGLVRDCVK